MGDSTAVSAVATHGHYPSSHGFLHYRLCRSCPWPLPSSHARLHYRLCVAAHRRLRYHGHFSLSHGRIPGLLYRRLRTSRRTMDGSTAVSFTMATPLRAMGGSSAVSGVASIENFFQAAPSSATRSRPVLLLILRLKRRSKLSCFCGARRRATMASFCLLLRLPPSVLFSNFLAVFGLRSVFVSLTPRLRFSHRSSDYVRNQDSWRFLEHNNTPLSLLLRRNTCVLKKVG